MHKRVIFVGAIVGVVAIGAAMLRLNGGGGDLVADEFPPFLMKFASTTDGNTSYGVISYQSANRWQAQWFRDEAMTQMVSAQHLSDDMLHLFNPVIGSRTDLPTEGDSMIPVSWLRRAEGLHPDFIRQADGITAERRDSIPCTADSESDCNTRPTVELIRRFTFDRETGIPIGYTESRDGRVAVESRVTSLEVGVARPLASPAAGIVVPPAPRLETPEPTQVVPAR